MKKMLAICLVGFMLFTSAMISPALAFTAQEHTQLLNKIQLIKQLVEQVNMVKNQYEMLKKLSSQIASGLSGANLQVLKQFDAVRNIWKDAKSLTHAMDSFMDKHAERNPEHKAGTIMSFEEERQRRDKENRDMLDSYLKGLNMNAKDWENSAKAREKLFETLQTTEGQVQAIQALGALINHTSMLIEKQNEITSSFVTMYAEDQLDKRGLEDNKSKNLKTALEAGKNEKGTGKGFKGTYKW